MLLVLAAQCLLQVAILVYAIGSAMLVLSWVPSGTFAITLQVPVNTRHIRCDAQIIEYSSQWLRMSHKLILSQASTRIAHQGKGSRNCHTLCTLHRLEKSDQNA